MTLWTLAPSSVEIWGEGALTGTKKKESCGLASLREVAFSEESSQLKASSQGGSQGNQHPDLHPSLCRLQRKPVAEAQWVPVLDVLLASSQLLKQLYKYHLRFTDKATWGTAMPQITQNRPEIQSQSYLTSKTVLFALYLWLHAREGFLHRMTTGQWSVTPMLTPLWIWKDRSPLTRSQATLCSTSDNRLLEQRVSVCIIFVYPQVTHLLGAN